MKRFRDAEEKEEGEERIARVFLTYRRAFSNLAAKQ